MLVPVANKLEENNLTTTFSFEYGEVKEATLQNSINPIIHQVSIKKSWLINYFSLYNSSSLKQKIGFFTYPIVLLKLILKIKPRYLLVANDIMFPSKILVKFCKHLNIPTLSLQHGALCSPFFPIEADKLGVYSEGVKNFIVQNNLAKKERIVSLGNPRWDNLLTETKQKQTPLTHSIVILSQAIAYRDHQGVIDKNIDSMFDLVSRIAYNFPNIQIVVKLHPLENASLWKEKIDFPKFTNLSLSDNNLISLLKQCTICVSGATTAFIEAALFGVKCLAYRPGDSSISVPKETEMDHFIEIFEDPDLLMSEIQRIIDINITIFPIKQDIILDHFGHSAEYIAQYIQSEIGT